MKITVVRRGIWIMEFLVFVCVHASGEVTEDFRQQLARLDIPLLEIETVDGEEPTYRLATKPEGQPGNSITDATKVPGRLRMTLHGKLLYDSGEWSEGNSGMRIKVRGNTSALVSPKKPYKIKLQKKADLLCRDDDAKYKEKDWVLIRDENLYAKIGFKVGELMNMPWEPAYKYVNVLFNGDYRGVYMLVEAIDRNEDCRINVSESGYIMEYDIYWWTKEPYIDTSISSLVRYTFKYPDTEDLSDTSFDYMTTLLGDVEASLKVGTWERYIDTESFARWMLARDILGNGDGLGSNIYITKADNTDSTKIKMGPLWDFNRIMERENVWDAAHYWFYYGSLFSCQAFVSCYTRLWQEKGESVCLELIDYMEDYLSTSEGLAVEVSLHYDGERWGKEYEALTDVVGSVRTYFMARSAWLDGAILRLIPSSIYGVEQKTCNRDRYYNLKGMESVCPLQKGIYIRDGQKYFFR